MNIDQEVEEVMSDVNERLDGKRNDDCKEFLDALVSEINELRDTFGE